MVALYKEAFGRGPTKARARFAGHDTLPVTLESSLTAAERNLVAMGEHRRLREARLFLADALEDQFREIVEQALGRKTLAYVSGIDPARDMTIDLFTLEPAGERSAPRGPEALRCRAAIFAVSAQDHAVGRDEPQVGGREVEYRV
jgi:uncharacterized protein YbcI